MAGALPSKGAALGTERRGALRGRPTDTGIIGLPAGASVLAELGGGQSDRAALTPSGALEGRPPPHRLRGGSRLCPSPAGQAVSGASGLGAGGGGFRTQAPRVPVGSSPGAWDPPAPPHTPCLVSSRQPLPPRNSSTAGEPGRFSRTSVTRPWPWPWPWRSGAEAGWGLGFVSSTLRAERPCHWAPGWGQGDCLRGCSPERGSGQLRPGRAGR